MCLMKVWRSAVSSTMRNARLGSSIDDPSRAGVDGSVMPTWPYGNGQGTGPELADADPAAPDTAAIL